MFQTVPAKLFSKIVGLALFCIVGLFALGLFWVNSDATAKCSHFADPVRAKIGNVMFHIPASFLPSFNNAPGKPEAPQSSYFPSNKLQAFGYCQDESDEPVRADTVHLIDGNTFQEALKKEYGNKFAYLGSKVSIDFLATSNSIVTQKKDLQHSSLSETLTPKALLFGKPVVIDCTIMDNYKSGNLCRVTQPVNNSVNVFVAYWSKEVQKSELENVFIEIEEFYKKLTKK